MDLSGEEEEVAEAVVTCCVDDAGNVLRMSMPGGTCGMDMVTAAALVEVAKTRQREIAQLMG